MCPLIRRGCERCEQDRSMPGAVLSWMPRQSDRFSYGTSKQPLNPKDYCIQSLYSAAILRGSYFGKIFS